MIQWFLNKKTNSAKTVLAFNDFTESKSDWVLSGYLFSGSKLNMVETNAAWSKQVYWNYDSNHDYQTIEVKLTLNNKNTVFRLGKVGWFQPLYVEVDFQNDVLRYYNLDQATVISSGLFGFNSQAGNDYIITISKKDYINGFFFKVTDGDNISELNLPYSGSMYPNEIGIMAGKPFISLNKGDVSVDYVEYRADKKSNIKLVCIGDSMVEAGAVTGDSEYISDPTSAFPYKWGTQLYNWMNGNVDISGLPGEEEDHLEQRVIWDVLPFNPKYCLLFDWGENSDYIKYIGTYTRICNILDSNNIIPILTTMQPLNGGVNQNIINTINDWIMNISGRRYVNLAFALTQNNDMVTFRADTHVPDMVHYNVLGNNLIYNQIKIDAPYLIQ